MNLFGSGLLGTGSELKLGHQGYSNLESSKVRLDLHGGGVVPARTPIFKLMSAGVTR